MTGWWSIQVGKLITAWPVARHGKYENQDRGLEWDTPAAGEKNL